MHVAVTFRRAAVQCNRACRCCAEGTRHKGAPRATRKPAGDGYDRVPRKCHATPHRKVSQKSQMRCVDHASLARCLEARTEACNTQDGQEGARDPTGRTPLVPLPPCPAMMSGSPDGTGHRAGGHSIVEGSAVGSIGARGGDGGRAVSKPKSADAKTASPVCCAGKSVAVKAGWAGGGGSLELSSVKPGACSCRRGGALALLDGKSR